MLHKHRLIALTIVTLLSFIGCQSKDLRSFFHLAYATPMATTNPILSTDLTAYNFLHNVHEGLMTYTADGQITHGLLEDITLRDDHVTYDLTLRSGLHFSDGTPLQFDDVLASWYYTLDPQTHAPFAHLYDVIKGVHEYREGLSESITGIELIDPLHMTITLERPFFFFLELLANPTFAILSHSWHEGTENWTSVSGAYRIAERDKDGSLWLVANPYHYAYSDEMLSDVKLSFISNSQVAYQLFKQEELDWMVKNVPLTLAKNDLNPQFILKNPPNGSYFILFNHNIKPYEDVRVRKALSIAINRSELTSLLEDEPEANSYITPFVLDRPIITMNLVEANRLLKEAGFNADNPLQIHYRHSSSWLDRTVASYLQDSWQKLDGVKVSLEAIESAQYRPLWSKGAFDLIRVSWFVSDYEDAKDFLQNFTKDNTFMKSGYHNQVFESLLIDADEALTLPQRRQLLEQAEYFLMKEEYAAIGLFSPINYHLVHTNKWQGIEPNMKDIHLLRYVRDGQKN